MKNVKKLLALLLAMTMLFALCACGDSDSKKDDKKDDDKKPEASQSANADPSTAPSNNSNTANKAPIGTWLFEEYNAVLTLNYDGTGELNGQSVTWQMLTDNSLRLVSGDEKETLTFVLNGDTVSFTDTDGNTTVWVKHTGSAVEEPDDQPSGEVAVTYDDELIATWYGEEGITMVLEEGGFGTLYLGDSDEYELVWGIVDGQLYLSREGEDLYAQYKIDGDNLTLTSDDGDTLTFVR